MIEFFRLGKTFKILKSSCDPYSICLGIFLCGIWLFQPACITEDGLSLTDRRPRQGSWGALFETTELLPWPWAALSSYQHQGLSLGYLKNLVMDSGFNGVVRIFLLMVIFSHITPCLSSLLHLCIGSVNVQVCFHSHAKVLLCSLLALQQFLHHHHPHPAHTF